MSGPAVGVCRAFLVCSIAFDIVGTIYIVNCNLHSLRPGASLVWSVAFIVCIC